MEALVPIAGLVVAAAITPGPNNLAVLQIVVTRGLRSALPAMAGIVLGGLAMLALGQLGLAALFDLHVWLRTAIVVFGGSYLAYLGVALVWQSFQPLPSAILPERDAPAGTLALFAFQFTNPKSWTLVLTVTAAMRSIANGGETPMETSALFAIFIVIPFASLLVWGVFGRVAARMLRNATERAHFDRAMGVMLVASAVLLLIHP